MSRERTTPPTGDGEDANLTTPGALRLRTTGPASLAPADPANGRALEIGERSARKYRNALRELATC